MTAAAAVRWSTAQRYLRSEVKRVVALLRSVSNPDAQAVGDWTVAQVAMHLSQAWLAVPGLARQDLSEVRAIVPGDVVPGAGERAGPSLIGDMWELAAVTKAGVDADPERDPAAIADRIAQRAAAYFAAVGGAATDPRPWLVEGVEVGLATLTGHLLNETVVHGWDIATGDGRRWDIPRDHAAAVFEGFLVPVMQALDRRALVNQELAVGLRATYEIRLKGAGRHQLVFDNGALTADPPSFGPPDCIITADPAALLLVIWGRVHQAKAIVERKLVASGPKAWLGPRLRSLMRNP